MSIIIEEIHANEVMEVSTITSEVEKNFNNENVSKDNLNTNVINNLNSNIINNVVNNLELDGSILKLTISMGLCSKHGQNILIACKLAQLLPK